MSSVIETRTPPLADQVDERGGEVVGDVYLFSAANPRYTDLKNSHRDHDLERGQDFSLHDASGTLQFHAAHRWGPARKKAPRHHHGFEQVRLVLSGEMEYNHVRYGPGWLGYFPEGVFYGPEGRTVDGCQATLQFQGPSGVRLHSRYDSKRGRDEIRAAGGVFKDGICTWPDGRKQDAAEAFMEQLYGPISYPDARFNDPLWWNTNVIPWTETAQAGVTAKRLGYFNDSGPAIQLLHIDPGASLRPGASDRVVFRFIYSGSAEYAGRALPSTTDDVVSAICYPPGARYDALSSEAGASILSIELDVPAAGSPYLL